MSEAELSATLLRRALAANGRTWLTVSGRSMAPLLHPGDQILLEPVTLAALRPGDILTVSTPHGLLTHRLRRASADGLLLAGDRLLWPDPPCAQTAVVGRVIARRRHKKLLSLTSGPGRRLNAALAFLARARPRSRLTHRALRLLAGCLTLLTETAVHCCQNAKNHHNGTTSIK